MGVFYGLGPVALRRFPDTVYSQSSVFVQNSAATYQYMNDGNANGSTNGNQTGTNVLAPQWVMANFTKTVNISYIVIGYDYLTNLPGGWGPTYTQNLLIQTSNDNASWSTVGTTPTYASTGSTNGLVTININSYARYIRLYNDGTGGTGVSGYMCLLEFQVWGKLI